MFLCCQKANFPMIYSALKYKGDTVATKDCCIPVIMLRQFHLFHKHSKATTNRFSQEKRNDSAHFL